MGRAVDTDPTTRYDSTTMITNATKPMSPAARASLACEYPVFRAGTDREYTAVVVRFNSLSDMMATRNECPARRHGLRETRNEGNSWTINWDTYRTMLVNGTGNETGAAAIESRVVKLSAQATTQPTWSMAPSGAYPIVPAALGGDPFCMRSRTWTESTAAPIRIYLPLQCSAALSEESYREILADCLAACRALSEVRPVELIGYGALDANYRDKHAPHNRPICAFFLTVPIEHKFCDYNALANWTDRSMGRTVVMGICSGMQTGWDGGWPWNRPTTETVPQMQIALGLSSDDLLIPVPYGRDAVANVRARMQELLARSGVELDLTSGAND